MRISFSFFRYELYSPPPPPKLTTSPRAPLCTGRFHRKLLAGLNLSGGVP